MQGSNDAGATISPTRPDTFTATLLMTDVENSTNLWEKNKEAMRRASARHDEIVEKTIRETGGRTSKSQWEGDSVIGVFPSVSDAAECALQLQLKMSQEPWPEETELKLRVAIYTGEAAVTNGMVSGPVVPRAISLRSLAYGGQVLVSETASELLRATLPANATLIALGSHRLRTEAKPEPVFQLCHPDVHSDFPPLRQRSGRQVIPEQISSFIGRKTEIRELKDLLERSRIVTVTGAGGLGKTRLCLKVADEIADMFSDGVFVVELEGVSDPLRVAEAIATALNTKERPPLELIDVLMGELQKKEALLVLDNCEHLVGSVADIVDSIVRGTQAVKILAASRQPLAVDGETLWRIPPLQIPPPGTSGVEALDRYESTVLFLRRIREKQPDFSPTPANAQAIADICRRLDGIPLAVELAASRVQVLSPEQIASRLGDVFGVLTGGTRTALPRQKTLQATIDWSFDLLGPRERRLFCDLSIFKGGFTIEAAEAVCELEDEEGLGLLDSLSALVDRSLVLSEESEGKARFRLLEALRQYGYERLVRSGLREPIAQRHLEYFADLAQRARSEMSGPRQLHWVSILIAEEENLDACLDWSFSQAQSTELALSIVGDMAWFWHLRGIWGRAHSLIGRALDAAPSDPSAARTRALIGAAMIGHSLGDPSAVDQAIAGEAMAMQIGDRRLESEALKLLGDIASARADYPESRRLHETALRKRREIGEVGPVAESLCSLADVLRLQGEYEASRRLSAEALDEMKKMGDEHGVAKVLIGMGHLEERQSNFERARSLYQQALEIRRRVGDVQGVATTLHSLANVAWAQGDQESAKEMFAMAADQMDALGDRYGMAVAISGLGHIAAATNDPSTALELYSRSLEIRRELGDRHGVGGSLHSMGNLALTQRDPERARELFEEALTIARALGSRQGMAATLNSLGNVAGMLEDYEAAIRYYAESLEIKRELGERHGIGISLANMGLVCMGQNNVEEAHGYFCEAHSICTELGMKSGIATSLHGLGRVDRARGFLADSVEKLCQSLRITEELDDKDALSDVLESLAGTLVEAGSPETAAKLFGSAESIRRAIDVTRTPMNDREVGDDLLEVEALLSKEKAQILMDQGAGIPLEDLLAEVRLPNS